MTAAGFKAYELEIKDGDARRLTSRAFPASRADAYHLDRHDLAPMQLKDSRELCNELGLNMDKLAGLCIAAKTDNRDCKDTPFGASSWIRRVSRFQNS